MTRLTVSRLIIALLIGMLIIPPFGLADPSPEKPFNSSKYALLSPDNNQFRGELIPAGNKSAYQLVRYSGGNLSSGIRPYVDRIDFQVSTSLNAWVAVYFKGDPGVARADASEDLRDFIIHRKEWTGNRSADSLASEIFISWMNDNIDGFIRSNRITTSLCTMIFPSFKKKPKNFIHPLYLKRYYKDFKNRAGIIVYSNQDLPADISRTVDSLRYQPGTSKDAQVFIYFRDDPGFASFRISRHIADFVMSRKEWAGDRSKVSVTSEIYLHWLADNLGFFFRKSDLTRLLYEKYVIGVMDKRESPVRPVDLGYYYAGLNRTPVMDPIIKLL